MMQRDTRKGVALAMVLKALALLLILAVPFALLMTRQEGTSVASLAGEQTRIVARTGADHAYAVLAAGNRFNEYDHQRATYYETQGENGLEHLPSSNVYRPRTLQYASIETDGYLESLVDLKDDLDNGVFPGLMQDGRPVLDVEDPRGLVLGVNVQDESGKVNLNAANVQLIANLMGSALVTEAEEPNGWEYAFVELDDAGFLEPYDVRGSDPDIGGAGYVVIQGSLFRYDSRVGNRLIGLEANPPVLDQTLYEKFNIWIKGGRIIPGVSVTNPTPYKIVYYRVNHARNGVPYVFNTIEDVRRIAEDIWFNQDLAMGSGGGVQGWPEGIPPLVFQKLLENATVVAPAEYFDGGFYYPHIVQQMGVGQPPEDRNLPYIAGRMDTNYVMDPQHFLRGDQRNPNPNRKMANYRGYGPFNLVRLRHPDGRVVLAVAKVAAQNGYCQLWIPDTVPDTEVMVTPVNDQARTFRCAVIETAERAKININTATYDTLVACFYGLVNPGTSNSDMRDAIPYDVARLLAREILVRTRPGAGNEYYEPFYDMNAFVMWLIELRNANLPGGPTDEHINAIRLQLMYPEKGVPNPTTTFRFDSGGTYSVDGYATKYAPSGGAVARSGFREWVSIGNDHWTDYSFGHYRLQGERQAKTPMGNIVEVLPWGTDPRYQPDQWGFGSQSTSAWLPYMRHPETERQFGDLYDNAQQNERFFQNVRDLDIGGGRTVQIGDLDGGKVAFWHRPYANNLDENYSLFDAGLEDNSNHIGLRWWGARPRGYKLSQRRNGLTLVVKDRTLDAAYTELRYELDDAAWRPRDWYHLEVNWKGTLLSHLNVLIDGDCEHKASAPHHDTVAPQRPMINHTFVSSSGAWVSRTSVLQDDLPAPDPDGTIPPVDIRLDPDDMLAFEGSGVIVIGDEAIEYRANDGYMMPAGALTRAARGTTAKFHPRGSTVTVFGYVSGLRSYNVNNNNLDTPRFPNLPTTQGQLGGDMTQQQVWHVSRTGSNNIEYWEPDIAGPDAGFAGAPDPPPVGANGNVDYLPLADTTGLPARGVVAVYGVGWTQYCVQGAQFTPGPEYYPAFDGNVNIAVPPATMTSRMVSFNSQIMKLEYIAYDSITSQGLHVAGRFDENFNPKTDPATFVHFMGAFTDEFPAPSVAGLPPAAATALNAIWAFLQQGSAVVLTSLNVADVQGYHDRSYVQVGNEWFFYNYKWTGQNVGSGTDFFPQLIAINAGRVRSFVRQSAASTSGNTVVYSYFRARQSTSLSSHSSGDNVTPVFGVYRTMGQGDRVTVCEDKNRFKEYHRVHRYRFYNAGPDGNLWTADDRYLAAFRNHVRHNFQPNNQNAFDNGGQGRFTRTNFLKFPTGELPVELPTNWTWGGTYNTRRPDQAANQPRKPVFAGGSGIYTDLEMNQFNVGNFRLSMDMNQGSPSERGDMRVNFLPTINFGVVKVDDELIAYRGRETRQETITDPNTGIATQITTYWLTDITRGVLGTQPGVHANGTPLMNMASLRICRPDRAIIPLDSKLITINGSMNMRPFGFVRIVEDGKYEVAGYQQFSVQNIQGPNGNTIRRGVITTGQYNPWEYQGGFRGSFGTRAQEWGERALIFDQPVRHPDWLPNYHEDEPGHFQPYLSTLNGRDQQERARVGIPGALSPEIAYMQGARTFRNTLIDSFQWRVDFPQNADPARYFYDRADPDVDVDYLGMRLVMRFRVPGYRYPDWDEIPTQQRGGLFVFEFDNTHPNTVYDRGQAYFNITEDLTQYPGLENGLRCDGLEYRVYFYYKQDSFEHGRYKSTLRFRNLALNLRQITRVLRHEERR